MNVWQRAESEVFIEEDWQCLFWLAKHLNIVSSLDWWFHVYLNHRQFLIQEGAHDLLRKICCQSCPNHYKAIRLLNILHHRVSSVVIFIISFVEEHTMRLHHGTAFFTFGHQAEILCPALCICYCRRFSCRYSSLKICYRWSCDELFTVILSFITTMHVVDIAVDLIDMLSKSYTIFLRQFTVTVFCLRKDRALLDLATMEVINVLSDQNWIHIWALCTVFLELCDRFVPCIYLLTWGKLYEIVVPFPIGHWVLVEKGSSQDFFWVIFVQIPLGLFPKAILAPESWDSACSTYTCTCQYGDLLALFQEFSCFFSCFLLWP